MTIKNSARPLGLICFVMLLGALLFVQIAHAADSEPADPVGIKVKNFDELANVVYEANKNSPVRALYVRVHAIHDSRGKYAAELANAAEDFAKLNRASLTPEEKRLVARTEELLIHSVVNSLVAGLRNHGSSPGANAAAHKLAETFETLAKADPSFAQQVATTKVLAKMADEMQEGLKANGRLQQSDAQRDFLVTYGGQLIDAMTPTIPNENDLRQLGLDKLTDVAKDASKLLTTKGVPDPKELKKLVDDLNQSMKGIPSSVWQNPAASKALAAIGGAAMKSVAKYLKEHMSPADIKNAVKICDGLRDGLLGVQVFMTAAAAEVKGPILAIVMALSELLHGMIDIDGGGDPPKGGGLVGPDDIQGGGGGEEDKKLEEIAGGLNDPAKRKQAEKQLKDVIQQRCDAPQDNLDPPATADAKQADAKQRADSIARKVAKQLGQAIAKNQVLDAAALKGLISDALRETPLIIHAPVPDGVIGRPTK